MKSTFLIPLVALLMSCSPGNKPMTEARKEAVRGEAAVVVREVFDVLKTGNGEKRMALCENSSDFSFTLADGVFSYDGLKAYVGQALQDAEKETFQTKSEKYTVIDPTCFTYIWLGKIEIYLKSGKTIVYDDYFSTWTFRKSGGTWKMLTGHESFKILK
jgi:hypothetical protein